MRGINESHYDEQSMFSSSDMEGSLVGHHHMAGSSGQNGSGQGNVYEVEHLATFQLSEDLNIPADGMKRLLHMEKNGFGIWSQKMRLRLESRYIVILDFENGDEMERFPLHLIREPTAFTNTIPGELYNNSFAFIVQPVEMHIFQCFNIGAVELVDDVKAALSGRMPPLRTRHTSNASSTHSNSHNLPPPPIQPPPEPPGGGGGGGGFLHAHPAPPSPRAGGGGGGDLDAGGVRDDTSSVGSEGRYEREVAILNRCFDDIERFIARLQYAAAAYRELQRRRKSKKSKKKDHGEGLLSMRARPPHEREFIDILQKFKLSFNLLARLKAHIHDPNAPELVHFLFTPLALIVDASRDAHTPGLASRVISPLLTWEAVELLSNCMTSKETELWHSLGEAWQKTRDSWKGYVAPYQPVFMDGWSPTIPDMNSSIGAVAASEAQRRMQERMQQASQQEAEHRRAVAVAAAAAADRERSISPVEMPGDDFGAGQRAFLDTIRSRGGRVVVVTHPRTANNHKELTVVRGEYLEVLDDTKKWWRARNWKGQIAHVPHTIVSPLSEYPQDYHVTDNGRSGQWSSPSSTMSSDDDFQYRGGNNKNKSGPPPPPPPPGMNNGRSGSSSPADMQQRRGAKKKTARDDDLMQQELKNVLTIFREKRKIEIQRTPEVYVSQNSSEAEVQEWLKQKGFSDRIRKQLSGMNGNELFKLKRSQLENYCGREEGRRLDSQITISRTTTGYKTARSSELRSILAKARARIEQSNFDNGSSGGGGGGDGGRPNSSSSYGNGRNEVYSVPQKAGKSSESSSRNSSTPTNNQRSNERMNKSRYDEDSEPEEEPDISFGLTDESDTDSSDDNSNNKGTLGKMLKKKRGEILRK